MRKILIGVAVVVGLVIVAAVVAPFLIPLEWVKQKAVEQVEAQTGRTLRIDGDVGLSLFPNVQVDVSDVSFANREGSDVADMVTLGSLGLDVALMPLLSGELVIDRFVLVEPVIYLETDASGQGNWVFQTPGGDGAGESTGDSADASGGGGLAGLRIGDVRIEDGVVTYRDGRTGETVELSAIDVSLSLPDLASPFSGQGSMVFKGQTVGFDVGVASLRALMDGSSSNATVKVESAPVTASFDGSVAAGGSLDGQVDVSVPSVRALAGWLAQPLPEGSPAPESVSVSGRLAMAGQRIDFTGATLSADALKATGDLGVDLSGARPFLSADLAADMLDLNPYLPDAGNDAASAADGGSASGDSGAAAEGWSEEPIDFSGLDAADADLHFELAGLKVRDIEIGRSVLAIVLDGGNATIDITEAQLYAGNGSVHLAIDRSGGRPAIASTVAVEGVEVEPLLTAATGFNKLSGTGDIALDVTTSGESERQLVGNLFGDGSFVFRDGAFKGANLAAMAREVSLDSLGAAVSGDQSTDFAELSASFDIADGVLRNDDLFMAAPLLRMSGAGNVNLPPRTLDYSIVLKPVASLEGQGADTGEASGGIPILVRGPWSDPSIGPDMEAIARGALENPEALGETLQNLGVDGEAGGLLDNLQGEGDGGGGLLDNLQDGGGDGAADALKSLFD